MLRDTVSQILSALHYESNIYLHSNFCSPWGLDSDNPGMGSFHVIAYGHCKISLNLYEELLLNAGDLIFFPRNIPHKIENKNNSDAEATTLICGSFDFGKSNNPLINALPDFIHIKANEISRFPWFESLFRHIVNEAEMGTEGKNLILDKLAEILFVYVLRYYVLTTKSESGVLAGLADLQLSKAIQAFHRDMSFSWTVEKLAQEALMSRSAFSERFSELVKMTPMQYVTHWRMQCAYNALNTTKDSILAVALEHGYNSEAAFSKVFKKQFGLSPGKARKQNRSLIQEKE